MPQLYMILPVGGLDGGRPDNTLPGGQGGYPSQPIYHPGHPDHGLPAYPDQGLPGGGQGGRPDQGLPPFPSQGLPEGGTDIPSNELPMPQPPQEYEDDLIVAVKKPNETEWTVKAYDPSLYPDQGPQPTPQSQSHSRSRRSR
ncbi:MAG: hypothetical protein WB562_10025 [Candidatus Sulfotelmatobacter sp.]